MKILTYRIIIEPDEKRTFHGYVPALLGCHTWGRTIAETKRHLRDAIAVYLKSLLADGKSLPRETSLESFETITVQGSRVSAVTS